MKTNHWVAVPAAVLAMFTMASPPCAAQSAGAVFPSMPSGWLTAFPTIVQTGTHPTLTWGINYPSHVDDYIIIEPPSIIVVKEEVDCEIRVIGAGVTASTKNGYTFVPTEAQVSYDGGAYTQIFYGTNLQVNPNTIVYTKTIPKGKKLRFGGRYKYDNKWGPYFNSSSGTQNLRTLVNGSTPPSNVPDWGAPSLEEFIKPYLTPNNKVKIGPMDAIIFMELTHTDSQMSNSGYDLQDMVLLLTFKSKAKTNNVPVTNINGVNSTNPGSTPFINLDTDPQMGDANGDGAAPIDP